MAVAKSSQLHEEKGRGAPRGVIRQPAGVARRGMGGGAGAAQPRVARGEGCARNDVPRRATRHPSVACRLRLCLCDSRRSVHRTRAPITTRAALPWPRTRPLRYRRIVFPNFRATCYDLTFGHLRSLTRLVYPSSCKCYRSLY